MQEAFNHAKRQIAEAQSRREFLPFIRQTREVITNLISPMGHLEGKNYGVSMPADIEGFYIYGIEAKRDLHMPDMEGYSMTVFIGRQKVGAIGAWINAHSRHEPRMVVDIAIEHLPSRKMASDQVFIIHRDRIVLWDRKKDPDNIYQAEDLPPGRSQDTRLITDVLNYVAKH